MMLENYISDQSISRKEKKTGIFTKAIYTNSKRSIKAKNINSCSKHRTEDKVRGHIASKAIETLFYH